jgi:maltose alpha-D-glucosyltransferase / alpha-amylase
MSYWLDHGVDGFRVDMAYSLVKLDPGHTETIKMWQDIGQKIHAHYPEMALIAEWGNPEESLNAGFDIDFIMHIGVGGYAELLLNENSYFRRRNSGDIRNFLESYIQQAVKTQGKGLIAIPSGNHDIKRPAADERTIRDLKVIFTFLLTWPGVPFIYYGDEIGMRYIKGLPSVEGGYGRTGSRTPMQWDDGPNAGFSLAGKDRLYLPPDPRPNRPTVRKQESDPGSLLNHVHSLITLRDRHPALQGTGTLIPLKVEKGDHHFAYIRQSRDERFLVVLNPAAEPSQVRIEGLEISNLEPQIYHGVRVNIENNDIQIRMAGVSYGVFKL